MLHPKAQLNFSSLKVGDFVNDCTGMNGKIIEIRPVYRRIGKGVGAVLLDVVLITENTGCSVCSCGVEPKLSREVVEFRHKEFLKDWLLGDGGKNWYGDKYPEEKARAERIIDVLSTGGHITDEDGRLLPEYKRGL